MAEDYAAASGVKTSQNYVNTSSTNDYYIKSVSGGKFLAVKNGALALSDLGYAWTVDTGSTGNSNTIQDPSSNKYIVSDGTNITFNTSSTDGDWKGLVTNSSGGE